MLEFHAQSQMLFVQISILFAHCSFALAQTMPAAVNRGKTLEWAGRTSPSRQRVCILDLNL